jgi:hypothetical protein
MASVRSRWFYSSRTLYEARPFISIGAGILALLETTQHPVYLFYGAVLVGCGVLIIHLRMQSRSSEIAEPYPWRNVLRRFVSRN